MTVCTHIKDGKPVTEIIEDGKVRPWTPGSKPKKVKGSATETAPSDS